MIQEQITTILQSIKQYDQLDVVETTNLIDHLGFTSMDIMNLILALEQHFSITFEDQDLDLDHFLTVGTVLDTLRSYHVGSV